MKRLALILTCCAVVTALTFRPASAEPSLGIGSAAPPLDIEHYFHEDDNRVTDFEKGKVYVVEFWATWCGPCIASMPHLAELQQKHRDAGVQIVSISDETVDEVEALLKKPHPEAKASFAEVTAPYTLTTDPDRSSHKEYMEAADQRGIPTSFIVGKSGVIEWIGHPSDLDEPLDAVIADGWDREAYKEKMEREQAFEQAIQSFARLAGTGKFDEAGKMLEEQIAATKDPEFNKRWVMVRHQFRLMTAQGTDEDFAFYRKDLADRKGNMPAVYQFAMTMYGLTQNGGNVGPLAGEAIAALGELSDKAEGGDKAALSEAMARLYTVDNDYEKALAVQTKAIADLGDDVPESMKRRMTLFLDELKKAVAKKAGGAGDKDEAPAK